MTRRLAVLRPQPGNAQTAARIAAMGMEAITLPLFAVSPIDWTPPDPDDFDALMLTSANAPRHAGDDLAAFARLPVLAVGARTALAATGLGFTVAATGTADAAALIARAETAGYRRILHLGGRDSVVAAGGAVARSIAVYGSDPLPVSIDAIDALHGTVALLHSARAAARLTTLVDEKDRGDIRLAALSPAILAAGTAGWERTAAAARPNDPTLLDLARTLAD